MAQKNSQRQVLILSRLVAGLLVLTACFAISPHFVLFISIVVTLISVLNIMAGHNKYEKGPLYFFIVTALVYNPFIRIIPADGISILINFLFGFTLILSWWRRW